MRDRLAELAAVSVYNNWTHKQRRRYKNIQVGLKEGVGWGGSNLAQTLQFTEMFVVTSALVYLHQFRTKTINNSCFCGF